MLTYEREYVLCGKHSDSENLAATALRLTALRSVFTFTSLIADPQRNGEVTALAMSISGFSGLPALLYVVKYLILTVWAVEEALVEVCALLAGRKVPVYSATGRIGIGEILTMTSERVREKAAAVSGITPGADYSQYLTLLSLIEGLNKKELRIADLIQENLRLKYRDSFRIKNCITELDFKSSVKAGSRFNTGFFPESAYEAETEKSICF